MEAPKDYKQLQEYVKVFRKKFSSFRTRSPIYFSFQVDPFDVIIQKEDNLDVIKFKIDYTKDVTAFIHEIHTYFRENFYPTLEEFDIKMVEPNIEDMNDYMKENDVSFDKAFNYLSMVSSTRTYIIDKIDKAKNRVVIYEEGDEESPLLFQLDIPVVVFLSRYTKTDKTPREIYDEFLRISTYIEKRR